MTTLAIDLGTTTGWAWRAAKGALVSGTWSLKPDKYSGAGIRGLKFVRYLNTLHAAQPITRVAFEAVRRHIGTDAAHVYGGLMLVLQAWCEQRNIPYEGIGVGTIKKFWTGYGNAPKDEAEKEKRNAKAKKAGRKLYVGPTMMGRAFALGYSPVDDNEADAIALLCLISPEAPDASCTVGNDIDDMLSLLVHAGVIYP